MHTLAFAVRSVDLKGSCSMQPASVLGLTSPAHFMSSLLAILRQFRQMPDLQ